VSKDRETRYFDFIHQHEERLNLIYRRWEDQIAKQTAANKSKTLVGRIKSHKKTALAGIAIAFGSALLACQYGKQVNASKTLITSNSQKLDRMTLELEHATAYQSHMACIRDGDIYQLTSNSLNHRALANEPRSFISQSDTISIIRHSIDTQQPDAYLRLNRDRSLLFGSIEQTNDSLETKTQVIDLDRDPTYLPNNQEAINNYSAVQENAIALHEELSQCFGNNGSLGTMPPFHRFPYAD